MYRRIVDFNLRRNYKQFKSSQETYRASRFSSEYPFQASGQRPQGDLWQLGNERL